MRRFGRLAGWVLVLLLLLAVLGAGAAWGYVQHPNPELAARGVTAWRVGVTSFLIDAGLLAAWFVVCGVLSWLEGLLRPRAQGGEGSERV